MREALSNALAVTKFTKLPKDISKKGWKEPVGGKRELVEFYQRWGISSFAFHSAYSHLQENYARIPGLTELAADFYATEYLLAHFGQPQIDLPLNEIYDLFGGPNTEAFSELLANITIPEGSTLGVNLIRALAWMRQVEVIQMLDEPIQNYFALAIGGELRWHPFIQEHFWRGETESDRDLAWQAWLPWVKKQPPTAYFFFEECFREFDPDEAYGGGNWADAASILRQRLMHEYSPDPFINAKLWLDRAFSCEHNNGCMFDKLYEVDCLPLVLEAHHDSELVELMDFTTPLVTSLAAAAEQSRLFSA